MVTVKSMSPISWIAALLAAMAFSSPAVAAERKPREVVEVTVAAVIGVLGNDALSKAEKRAGIEKIAYARFDFRTFTRLVTAKYWKRFSTEQKKAFFAEFKVFLAQEYGTRLDDYENQSVEVLDERVEPRGDVTVRTRIVGGDFDDASVDYRMRKKDDDWFVIDVVIEGVSLVSNWRDQFREVLRGKNGVEDLLAQLRTKNKNREEGRGPPASGPPAREGRPASKS